MKILSIRQPWIWAILHAGKLIENRTWQTNFRGHVLLHAAQGCTRSEWLAAFQWMREQGLVVPDAVPSLHDVPRGGIVGRAFLGRVLSKHLSRDVARLVTEDSKVDLRWWEDGCYGFVLSDVQPLPFVPWKGSLGLRDVPPELMTQLGL